jgi:hypothetical protein
MTAIAPNAAIRDELRGSLGGELVTPGDPTYDQLRRVWNGSSDRSPALIARCRRVADVVAAIRFARATGLPVAVRGGGHSYGMPGADLSATPASPASRSAAASAGCTASTD